MQSIFFKCASNHIQNVMSPILSQLPLRLLALHSLLNHQLASSSRQVSLPSSLGTIFLICCLPLIPRWLQEQSVGRKNYQLANFAKLQSLFHELLLATTLAVETFVRLGESHEPTYSLNNLLEMAMYVYVWASLSILGCLLEEGVDGNNQQLANFARLQRAFH